MNLNTWKIFDKKGSPSNWYQDSYLNMTFVSDLSNVRPATAYCITDPSGYIDEVVVTNSGLNYDTNTAAILDYTFDENSILLTSAEASINYIDVSIFSPQPENVLGIGGVDIDLSTNFIYPSVSFTGAIFLEPVAVGLVETEHLTILQETSAGYVRPYDPSSQMVFRFIDGDDEIKLFTVKEDEQIIIWADELVFDTDVNTSLPLTINIGFKAVDEGIFERRMGVFERKNGIDYIMAEFIVNGQSIAQDKRFDTILQNLAPMLRPSQIPKLFKEANINESLPDWELINYKAKHAVLEFNQITPYIGSYKALINAIKWLGYEDIKVQEWFKNVKEGTKLGLYVPYDAAERKKTILYFTDEERRNLKKLNELSLIYCINRDTGEVDEWGNPETINCYEYNLDEILTKLFALKKWLELNIIGVHAKIIDLTGEGIYYERFRNLIYGTQDIGTRAQYTQSLTPITCDESSELKMGDSSICLSLKEYGGTKIKDFNLLRFKDFIDYGWDASGYIPADASILEDFDASLVRVGPTFRNPLYNLFDIQWRATTENTDSGVLTNQFVTNPLWIYDNDIRWYDIFDDYSKFYDISTNLDLVLEKAYFRDAGNDNWEDSVAYSIYLDPSLGQYVMESSSGVLTKFHEYAVFSPIKRVGSNDDYTYSGYPTGAGFFDHTLSNAVGIIFSTPVDIIALDVSTQFSSSSGSSYSCYITGAPFGTPNLGDIKYFQSFIGAATVNIDFPSINLKAGNYAVVFLSDTDLGIERQRQAASTTGDFTTWTSTDRSTWSLAAYDLGVIMTATSAEPGAELIYGLDSNYMAPLLSFKNYKYTDASGVTQTLDDGKKYFLDILDGRIDMDSSLLDYNGDVYYTTQSINFNYDTSLIEQKITLNVEYNSPRMQLYQYDPSVYYYLESNNLDPSSSLIIDNSVYRMPVNFTGDYFLEVFGWDGTNTLYNNIYRGKNGSLKYNVWTKYPTILAYIDSSIKQSGFLPDASWNYLNGSEASILYGKNIEPIFDRSIPLQGLTLEKDSGGRYYIKVPSITYFQDVPDPGSISKFYNLTERCVSVLSPTSIEIDPDFQNFYQDDSINIVLFNKGNYDIIDQSANNVANISGTTLTLDSAIPSGFVNDSSTQIYIQNDTWRTVNNVINNSISQTVSLDVSGYTFVDNQLVGIIINDTSTGYSWGSSFRVIDTSGSTHTMEGNIPEVVLDPSRFDIYSKHSFSTFSNFQIDVESATEVNNNFHIYSDDTYYHQYYLDNTFVYLNILFDQEKVIEQWLDPSDGLLSENYYPFDSRINVDVSTLVILKAVYDPSNYMLNQQNLWSIKNHEDGDLLMKVFNDSVFYIFDASGTYDISVESYDYYGNLKTQTFEGLITVG